MKILIDNGHGIDTKGKRSPDGRLLEYRENRIIARGIVNALTARGLDASLLVPEETDISLPERCRRGGAMRACPSRSLRDLSVGHFSVGRLGGASGAAASSCKCGKHFVNLRRYVRFWIHSDARVREERGGGFPFRARRGGNA